MKKILCSLAIIFLINFSAKAIDASVTFATFTAPEQPYIEVYLYILGPSIERKMLPDSSFQSNLEVMILFKQEEKIVKFDKYLLNGPIGKEMVNLYDLKRYGLANGAYDLEITIKDANREGNNSVYKTTVNVNYDKKDALMQSDIELLSSIRADQSDNPAVKNGYYLEVLPFNFYHKNTSSLIFYNEIYNTDKAIGDDFLVRYSIEKVNGNGSTETMIIGNKKRKPEAVNVVLQQMDISKLPSGNYNLVVEIRNRAGELLSDRKMFFQRSNPYLDLELAQNAPLDDEFVSKLTKQELRYSLKAIAPIVKDADVEILNYLLDDVDNLEAQRRYLFTFWAIESPVETSKTYEQYMTVARMADEKFQSGFGYGFETDSGNLFMYFGLPNDIVTVEDEATAPPYEIWVYENFPKTKQNRVKFIFYNPTLSPGDYQLLHSTALGETNNPQWEVELYRDAPDARGRGTDYFSGTTVVSGVNRNARRLFDDL